MRFGIPVMPDADIEYIVTAGIEISQGLTRKTRLDVVSRVAHGPARVTSSPRSRARPAASLANYRYERRSHSLSRGYSRWSRGPHVSYGSSIARCFTNRSTPTLAIVP